MAHLLEALRVVVRGGHPHETTVRRSALGRMMPARHEAPEWCGGPGYP